MKKAIKGICLIMISLGVFLITAIVYGFYSLPDDIYSFSKQDIDVGFYSCSLPENKDTVYETDRATEEYKLNISLFNKIPVKTSNLTVSNRRYVVPSGEIVGLRLFAKGVMVINVDEVDVNKGRINPGKLAKLQKGDVITEIDGIKVESSVQVDKIISSACGKALNIAYTRNGISYSTVITPVYSVTEKRYKTGLWIRDSAAGIGTMTFYEKNSGFFACLGHAVCDIDTGEVLPLSGGDIVEASIGGCVKGRSGMAGELCGNFKVKSLGNLFVNESCGVFGYLNATDKNAKEVPIALKSEIKTGYAQIISTVENENKAYYDIEIEKITPDNKDDKNMVIKITDAELIEKTGGIVQGMSGSPIIQDGRLVGAVTHVFLNDPTRGYGIFAETMLRQSKNIKLKQAG